MKYVLSVINSDYGKGNKQMTTLMNEMSQQNQQITQPKISLKNTTQLQEFNSIRTEWNNLHPEAKIVGGALAFGFIPLSLSKEYKLYYDIFTQHGDTVVIRFVAEGKIIRRCRELFEEFASLMSAKGIPARYRDCFTYRGGAKRSSVTLMCFTNEFPKVLSTLIDKTSKQALAFAASCGVKEDRLNNVSL